MKRLYLRDLSYTDYAEGNGPAVDYPVDVEPSNQHSLPGITTLANHRLNAGNYGAYGSVGAMTLTPGSSVVTRNANVTEPGSPHYGHFGSWAAYLLKGGVKIGGNFSLYLDAYSSDPAANIYPRIAIFINCGEGGIGGGAYVFVAESQVAVKNSYDSLQCFFDNVPINVPVVNDWFIDQGDFLIVELSFKCDNSLTSAVDHGIKYGGAVGSGSESYFEIEPMPKIGGRYAKLTWVEFEVPGTPVAAKNLVLPYRILPQLPAAPTNLTIQISEVGEVQLEWVDNSNNEDSFRVEYSVDQENWILLGNASANATGYVDTNPSYPRHYRVCAENLAGYSDYSNVATAVGGDLGEASVTGQADFSAALTQALALAGTATGVGSLSSVLSLLLPLTAQATGIGLSDAQLSQLLALGTAQTTGVGELSAELSSLLPLVAATAGVAEVTADLSKSAPLSAQAVGEATISAILGQLIQLIAATVGTAQLDAALSQELSLQALATGSASVSAFIEGQSAQDLGNAVATGVGGVTAALDMMQALIAQTVGESSMSATMEALRALAASMSGRADVTAEMTLSGAIELIASATGVGVFGADLSLRAKMPSKVFTPGADTTVFKPATDTVIFTAKRQTTIFTPKG